VEIGQRPERDPLRLLPSGPDRVGEASTRRRSPPPISLLAPSGARRSGGAPPPTRAD